MKSVYIFLLFLCFLFLPPAMSPAQAQLKPSDPLWPPTELVAHPIECFSYLSWKVPHEPGGGIPPGLIGYYVYSHGYRLGYVSGQDTNWYYDMLEFRQNIYTVTAYYDLAYYGAPGHFMESAASNAFPLNIVCGCCLPFYEPWNNGYFAYQDWRLYPQISNWGISTQEGNPVPCAKFTGNPVLTNYEQTIQSTFIPMTMLSCSSVYLSFDLKLINVNPTGTEKIIINAKIDTLYYPVDTIVNTLEPGWHHYDIDIAQFQGNYLRIRFTASGENSMNITAWELDNIVVDFTCHPPTSTRVTSGSGNKAELSWTKPPCPNPPPLKSGGVPNDPASPQLGQVVYGYNVYRSDSSGSPPFTKINSAMLTDTLLSEPLPAGLSHPNYKWYVTVLYKDTIANAFLCESAPGDTVKITSQSAETLAQPSIQVYPNPSSAYIIITSDAGLKGCRIMDLSGKVIREAVCENRYSLTMETADLPSGVYVLRISTSKGTVFRKLVR